MGIDKGKGKGWGKWKGKGKGKGSKPRPTKPSCSSADEMLQMVTEKYSGEGIAICFT